MRLANVACAVGCALFIGACGDDSTGASGTEGGTADSDGTAGDVGDDRDSVDETGVDETADADSGAQCVDAGDCDAAACMAAACNAGACELEPTLTAACRPQIEIDFPPRGATVLGARGEAVVVTGTVTTGVGTIESLTASGEPVVVEPDGSFSFELDPQIGGNTLLLDVVDSNAWTRRRVQSFLWSTGYALPTEPIEGAAPQGILLNLGQQSIDDGDRSPPINDLASVFQLVLDGLDVGSFVDPTTPIASQAGYDIYVTSLDKGSVSTSLVAIDGGMHLEASLNDIVGDLDFDCTNFGCALLGGDSSGGLAMSSVLIRADMLISVSPTHEMQVDIANVETQVNDLDIWSNNIWTNFLLSIIEPLILDGIVTDVENLLTDQVYETLGPMLVGGLAGFSISAPLDFPNLADPTDSITVALETDIGATDFQDGVAPPRPSPAQSGLIEFRGGGYVDEITTPYDNLGIPNRAGCGMDPVAIAMPRLAALEIGLGDELLNQLLYGAWQGGMLEFNLPASGGDGGATGIVVKEVRLSGMLAPTAMDCHEGGVLLAHVGDLGITATIAIGGVDIDFVAFSSLAMRVEVGADDAGISLAIPGVEWMETELTVEQDEAIPMEGNLREILDAMLEQQLLDGLSGGGFGAIALPEIDLSGAAGLPPGSALLSITVDGVQRQPGVTVVEGHF